MLGGAEAAAASLLLSLSLKVGGKRVTTDKPFVLGGCVRDKVPVAVDWPSGR